MRPDLRILHLARDEKFVPLLRRLFDEALPVTQTWLIAHRARAPVQFVGPGPGVRRRPEWRLRTPLAALDLAQADVIVAHSMPRVFAQAIARARPSARVVWIGWGYDYYPLLSAQLGDPLLPLTRRLMGAAGPQAEGAAGSAEAPEEGLQADPSETSGRWRRWWTGVLRRPHALQQVAPRIHTFCVLPPEEALLRRALPALQARPHELPLFTTEDVFERGPVAMAGPDILLGNSATASNNHADAMAALAGRIGAGRLVVPLSYGNASYGDRVVALGRQQFGDRFEPLRDWMPLDAYNARLGSCGFVVMNHRRQQAVGNIGSALFKGATVYLRRENPLFDFYTGLGITLRPIEALADGGQALQPLSAEQRDRNRALIGAHYARSRVLAAIRQLPALQD